MTTFEVIAISIGICTMACGFAYVVWFVSYAIVETIKAYHPLLNNALFMKMHNKVIPSLMSVAYRSSMKKEDKDVVIRYLRSLEDIKAKGYADQIIKIMCSKVNREFIIHNF